MWRTETMYVCVCVCVCSFKVSQILIVKIMNVRLFQELFEQCMSHLL